MIIVHLLVFTQVDARVLEKRWPSPPAAETAGAEAAPHVCGRVQLLVQQHRAEMVDREVGRWWRRRDYGRPQAQAVAERRPRSRLRVHVQRRARVQPPLPAAAAAQQPRCRWSAQPGRPELPAQRLRAAAAPRVVHHTRLQRDVRARRLSATGRVLRAAVGPAAHPSAVQPGPGARALRQHHRGGRLPDDAAAVAGQDVLDGAALGHGRPLPVPRGRGAPGATVAAVHAVPGPAGLVVRRIVAVLVAHVHRVVVHHGRGHHRGRATHACAAGACTAHVRHHYRGPGKYNIILRPRSRLLLS